MLTNQEVNFIKNILNVYTETDSYNSLSKKLDMKPRKVSKRIEKIYKRSKGRVSRMSGG